MRYLKAALYLAATLAVICIGMMLPDEQAGAQVAKVGQQAGDTLINGPFVDPAGKYVRAVTNDAGNLVIVLAEGTAFFLPDGGVDFSEIQVQGLDGGYPLQVYVAWSSSVLSAGGGDVLSTLSPSGACNASGYQLTPQDATLRIQFHDCTTAHAITQWGCVSGTWEPGGQIVSDPSSSICSASLFLDHMGGPIYLQSDKVDGGVGSAITVDVSKAVTP